MSRKGQSATVRTGAIPFFIAKKKTLRTWYNSVAVNQSSKMVLLINILFHFSLQTYVFPNGIFLDKYARIMTYLSDLENVKTSTYNQIQTLFLK